MKYPLYMLLARDLELIAINNGNKAAFMLPERQKHLRKLVKEHMPSGSGIDNGTVLNEEYSGASKIQFDVGFHHMDDNGSYNGWTQHKVTVTPSLAWGFKLSISGPDRNQIKDYLHEAYDHALKMEVSL